MICAQCGDPLMKKTLINSRKIFGLVVLSAFLAPLFIMIYFVIKEFRREKLPNNSESAVLLSMGK